MTKKEFMDQLARLLGGLSQSERQEALDYYNSYFDDAGPENEAAVIQELGSPGKVAAIIKADLADEGEDFGEYTEKGFQDTRSQEEGQMPEMFQKQDRRSRGYQVRRRRDSGRDPWRGRRNCRAGGRTFCRDGGVSVRRRGCDCGWNYKMLYRSGAGAGGHRHWISHGGRRTAAGCTFCMAGGCLHSMADSKNRGFLSEAFG